MNLLPERPRNRAPAHFPQRRGEGGGFEDGADRDDDVRPERIAQLDRVAKAADTLVHRQATAAAEQQ